jgi:hypothetical protein
LEAAGVSWYGGVAGGTLLSLLSNAVLALIALNFGILLFYRAHSHQRKLAVRCAMGASQFNIARQILLESACLCGVGLLISLRLAAIILFFMGRAIAELYAITGATISSWMSFKIDSHALLTAFGITFSLWFLARTSRIKGVISRVDPAVNQGAVVGDVDLLGELPVGARPQLQVEGIIYLSQLPNTLYVGKPAYVKGNSTIHVYRVEPDGTRRV